VPDGSLSTSEVDAVQVVSAYDRTRNKWCIGSRLVVATSVLWLLFSIVRGTLSGRSWMGLILDLAPPLSLLVTPLCISATPLVALAIGRRLPKRALLITLAASLGAFLLGVGPSGVNLSALSHTKDSPLPANAVRVFSWNTEYWEQGNDRSTFFQYLLGQHADIYLLQEYIHWNQHNQTPIEINDIQRLQNTFPGYYIRSSGELMTLSRYPIVNSIALSPDGPRRGTDGKDFATSFEMLKTLRTDIKIGSSVTSFYNVHIPVQLNLELNTHFFDEAISRNSSRRTQYRLLRADVSANHDPFLVAGDFNTSPSMGDIAWLRGHLTDPTPALRSFYPTSWQDTGALPRGWRLDWVFTSSIRVHRYRFQTSEGLSDHRSQQLVVSIGGTR
jgi:hypothetical protein